MDSWKVIVTVPTMKAESGTPPQALSYYPRRERYDCGYPLHLPYNEAVMSRCMKDVAPETMPCNLQRPSTFVKLFLKGERRSSSHTDIDDIEYIE